MSDFAWRPYVPVAKRRANARREIQKLRDKGMKIEPVEIEGPKITNTFWGQAWCKHLEQLSDFENRLPRGRTYVRNGSICHLAISKGHIEAIVSGSELYKVNIHIKTLSLKKWQKLLSHCAGRIGSALELLQGQLSSQVMGAVTNETTGIFPLSGEINLNCDCPDWAKMCKHAAAVLYGIGSRLDRQPELLFILRNVDYQELIATELDIRSAVQSKGKQQRLLTTDLSSVFGIDIDSESTSASATKSKSTAKTSNKSVTGKKKSIAKKATANNPAKINRDLKLNASTVKKFRAQLGISQADFAKLAGVSTGTISKWENSQGELKIRATTQDLLNKIASLTPRQAKNRLKHNKL